MCGAWANADRARMVRTQPESVAAEQGALWIASPARPYRGQRSRNMATATRTIAGPFKKEAPRKALGETRWPAMRGQKRAGRRAMFRLGGSSSRALKHSTERSAETALS